MTDILFITSSSSLALYQESNGTLLLATKLLQAGFDAKLLRFCQIDSYRKDYFSFIRDITDKILEIAPRCVSFYTLWPHYHIMLRIARELKQRRGDMIIVLGGPQSSATAGATMEAMPFVDYICTGEGENTVVPFFRSILNQQGAGLSAIPGLYYRQNGVVTACPLETPLCDLNTLPHWDDRLYLQDHSQPEPNLQSDTYFMPIDAGRGCPYSCSFCCTSHFWRRTYRLKSPQRIAEDIRFYNRKFGIRSFWFSHDAFTTNRQLVSQVCDHILAEGLDIRWKCTARVDCITEELVLKMKRAGMTHIELGIETGSRQMQKLINKNLDLNKACAMISFLLKQGIDVGLFFMHGFPEETEEDLNETLELLFSLLDMGVNHVSMSFCRFNPATQITQQYFDRLVFDPRITVLSRGVYGFREEMDMIRQHKTLFPFLYHLDTPMRNEYQYLSLLVHLYQKFPETIRHLRRLYQGDNLKFYRDFYHNNVPCFEGSLQHTVYCVVKTPVQMLYNTIQDFDAPWLPQLKALLNYEYQVQTVRRSETDIAVEETFDFSYFDYKLDLPIRQYSAGQTRLRISKENGLFRINVLSVT